MTDPVRFETSGSIARVTIDRPERGNALDDAVVQGIIDGIDRASADPAVRAIVLTGAGDRIFCAGGDLKPDSDAFGYDISRPGLLSGRMIRVARQCPLPMVARINGHCMAGGMALLGMCDLAISTDHARFGLPEVKVGLFPMQVAALLKDLVPARTLAEISLTGEPFSAADAAAYGLVNYVVPAEALDEKLDWLLARLLGKSPTAQRRGRIALRTVANMPFDGALAHLENEIALLSLTEDGREGRRAFVERRPPRWTGR